MVNSFVVLLDVIIVINIYAINYSDTARENVKSNKFTLISQRCVREK